MKRSRAMSIGLAVGLAFILVLATGLTAHGALAKKSFTAGLSPSTVVAGVSTEYTLSIKNTATSQMLGACNLTVPSAGGFIFDSVVSGPSPGSATLSADKTILQLRDMSTAPTQERVTVFKATATTRSATKYVWSILCRQANNFSPDQPSNKFTTTSVLETLVVSPLPNADLEVTSNTASQEPVTGANTVVYSVVARNNGPENVPTITLTDSLPDGGTITTAFGETWSCPGPFGGSTTECTFGPLASGAPTTELKVHVLAPNQDTTITNRATVSGSDDSDPSNNTKDAFTTVNKDSTCDPNTISCGEGTITYALPSSVTTGDITALTPQRFHVGTTTFAARPGFPGSQPWGMSAPAQPGRFCPIDFAGSGVTDCTWQMNLDIIPDPYTGPGQVLFEGFCHSSRCPQGAIPGFGTVVVKIADDGSHTILPQCNGANDTRTCFEQARVSGHLRIRVRNITFGDPRIGGVCIGGGC